MYRQIRLFFAQHNVLEVETPIFSQSGNTDPAISSVIADFSDIKDQPQARYAHTSPEFPMKRLLAKGSGAIYQICKVFRKGESGRLHSPEFSMLEWYRPGMDYHQLIDEVAMLLNQLGLAGSVDRVSYSQLFQTHLKLDVLQADVQELKDCAAVNGLKVIGFNDDYDAWTAMLLANLIEPKLGFDKPVFIYDYPTSQAALAKIRSEDQVAERFELYINGVEIANGYQELTDVEEYRRRFIEDNKKRQQLGLEQVKIGEQMLSDLSLGFPESAGVALGLDRLLMMLLAVDDIADVLSFNFSNA